MWALKSSVEWPFTLNAVTQQSRVVLAGPRALFSENLTLIHTTNQVSLLTRMQGNGPWKGGWGDNSWLHDFLSINMIKQPFVEKVEQGHFQGGPHWTPAIL